MKKGFHNRVFARVFLLNIACFILSTAFVTSISLDLFANEPDQTANINLAIEKIFNKNEKIYGEQLNFPSVLRDYYQTQQFTPLWIHNDQLISQAKQLIKIIKNVGEEGLNPKDYHFVSIMEILGDGKNLEEEDIFSLNDDKISQYIKWIGKKKEDQDIEKLADLDVLLTDAFLTLSYNFLYGFAESKSSMKNSVIFTSIKKRAFESSKGEEIVHSLHNAIGVNKMEALLYGYLPHNNYYNALKKEMIRFDKLAKSGEWLTIKELSKGKKIKLNERDERIPLIKDKFNLKCVSEDINCDVFDESLQKSVIEFQEMNGLIADGVIGWETIKTLNISPEERLEQVKINMDRVRVDSNLFDDSTKIIVNIPEFVARIYENGKEVLKTKVVVGMVSRKTPLVSGTIERVIFSPKWFVPDLILIKDKIPKITKDPQFLKKMWMKVYVKGEKEEVNPETIDWNNIEPGDVPYRIVQEPGGANALGRIKFVFRNIFDVYMHDTPSKDLFGKTKRTFSSGCIRLEKPVEVGEFILRNRENWNKEKIEKAMFSGKERIEELKTDEKVPLHVIYLTFSADDNEKVQFKNDVYGYDKEYAKILQMKKL